MGGGFAGLACARHLAKDKGVEVTLVDRLDYSQFLPLLYPVRRVPRDPPGRGSARNHGGRGERR